MKPLGEFYKHKGGKYGVRSWCKECANKYVKDKYANDPEYRKKQNAASCGWHKGHYKNDPEYRKKKKQVNIRCYKDHYNRILKELKVNGCSMCGKQYSLKNTHSFHFHHVEPELKNFNLHARGITLHTNKEIIEEIQKCLLVCQSCHQKIHAQMKST